MNKFDECYDISSQIIEKYTTLIYSSIYGGEFFDETEFINEIKKLVIIEYNLIHSLSFEELEECMKLIDDLKKLNNNRVLIRLRNKLLNYREILLGKVITGSELGIYSEFNNMQFSISDAIVSMVDIEVIKSIKSKIYSSFTYYESDKNFISSLKEELEMSKLDLLYSLSVSEVFGLICYGKINKLPNIDVDKIRKKIEKLGNCSSEFSENTINYSVAFYAKQVLDELVKIKTRNNNPSDVFEYLNAITRIEVFTSYMNNGVLNVVYDYCCNISDSTLTSGMKRVKKIIKDKIDNC